MPPVIPAAGQNPTNNLLNIDSSVIINRQHEIPCYSWHVRAGAYGSVGTADIHTGWNLLRGRNINLAQIISNTAPGDVTAVDVYVYINGRQTFVFGGGLDTVRTRLEHDTIKIEARDGAAPLVDNKRVLTNINYANQTPDQIARSVAQQYGLGQRITPVRPRVLAGSIFGQDGNFTVAPQAIWNTLQQLARGVGYVCRVTPQNELYFGPPDNNQQVVQMDWAPPPETVNARPLRSMELVQNPRRNRSFIVRVYSYHPKLTQSFVAHSVSNPTGAAAANQFGQVPTTNRTVQPGQFKGQAGQQAGNALTARNLGIPVFTKYVDGLTQDQCQKLADSLRDEIARREVIVTGEIDIYPGLLPQMPVRFREYDQGRLMGIANKEFTISSVTHSFQLPEGGGTSSGGYTTEFTALSLPAAASGDPNAIFGNNV